MGTVREIFSDAGDGVFPLAAGEGGGSISVNAAKPVATIAQLADYLVSGFWAYNNALPHKWASNTITYNITGLNADEQFLARSALAAWRDVANLTFIETTGTANITFTHNGSMQAVTNASWYGSGAMASATVNISTNWVTSDGGANDGKTGIDSYAYQTYIHEIGHALGLGHQGPYNGSAAYSANALYANDTWQYSIMSYFSQPNYSGSSYRYVVTPQMADIYAVGVMYGTATTTRTGDTVYGFNSNAGAVFSFGNYTSAPALTIYDNGGSDTLDCSLYSSAQRIDLHGGAFSSVGGLKGNIGIANGCTIENAIGGAGADTIVGNGTDNLLRGNGGTDSIDGGAGTDTAIFNGNRANYTLTDLGNGSVRVVGPDGTDTLTNVERLQFADQMVNWPPAGAAQSPNDFNSDGMSDILWRNDAGAIQTWSMNNGTMLAANGFGTVPANWQVLDTNDFNGDGRADMLWRNSTNGAIQTWDINNGTVTDTHSLGVVPSNWHFIATGDFDGDNNADILWRNGDGAVALWALNNSTFVNSTDLGAVPNNFSVLGTDDFNGDGRTDILWRNITNGATSIWDMNGGTVQGTHNLGGVPTNWQVVGTGDFNGDGHSDILWQNSAGALSLWDMNNGDLLASKNVGTLPGHWHIEDTGDYNGDQRSDILLRNDDGIAAIWQMNDNHIVITHSLGAIPDHWHILA